MTPERLAEIEAYTIGRTGKMSDMAWELIVALKEEIARREVVN